MVSSGCDPRVSETSEAHIYIEDAPRIDMQDGGSLAPDAGPLVHDEYAPPEVPTVIIDGDDGPQEVPLESAVLAASMTVEQAIVASCSTSIVSGLSEQLIGELQCLRPGTLESVRGIANVSLGSAASQWMQAPAARALRRAAARRSATMFINSSLRTLPQQYLLYRWQDRRCGISIAAPPGLSNHNGALAIDIESNASWRSALEVEGFRWLGSSDPVHFDYVGSGTSDIRSLSVLAFQRLWNRNNPGDRIAEDGDYGATTESRLRRAPARGFPVGASCSTTPPRPPPPPPPPVASLELDVRWERLADDSYRFTTSAPSSVAEVGYFIDGFAIGVVPRGTASTYERRYVFGRDGVARSFEVRAFNAAGAQVGRATGAIDVSNDTAVFVRPSGGRTWEIGLERAPSAVVAIEVRADGYLLSDGISGRPRSTRLAVQSTFSTLGERDLEIRTYGTDGALRGTLRRTVTLAR